MTDKKKADQQASHKNTHLDNTSGSAQRRRLLDWMRSNGPIDTMAARRDLNILMPAARIKELKDQGYTFHTQRVTITDEQGRAHSSIALYTLIGEPTRRAAA
ncbi:helix-turn-helix domain-containing protein [Pseudomonas fluorescens]|uniref:helix-turn-helix domain-containing protein n=1 Tax=Pseudomonas fluorescens TaxID=294 RepID=UPI001242DFD5|nr:helix-turn-helix domain-containing protein [Pseudomonas fluorescens]VVM99083.1 hypothetical protein PS639_03189 [Pseudomonas fluorescens]